MQQFYQPAKITIFLIHGDPNGLRTAEISNWTGKAIAAPRTQMKELFARPEMKDLGIYILTGTEPETDQPAVYIGETESILSRIKGHSDKDFWTNIIVFISKDENLNKAHIKYLEGSLITLAKRNSNLLVMNSVSSGARLSEPETAEMDIFLDKILQLLPVLGVNHFNLISQSKSNIHDILTCGIKGLSATGKRTPTGFIVYKDSQAVLAHRPSAKSIKKLRKSLVDKGILVKKENHLMFVKDYEFKSPSAACGVVHGGNVNGLRLWKNKDGKSLAEIENIISK